MYSIQDIKKELQTSPLQKIVFPEGDEPKIQKVANTLVEENLANPILIFEKRSDVPQNLNSQITILVMEELDKQPFINKFLEIRKDKATLELAQKVMSIRAYIGAMLIKMAQADAMVCGLTFTTVDTLRPTLQIIKTKPSFSLAASVFIMQKGGENLIFTDCALNVCPTAQQLAEITKMAVQFAKDMNVPNPEAVLLSYSTKGSGLGADADRVREAVKILETEQLNFNFDGEFQFDAAIDQEVRQKKAPTAKIKKQTPDVFVFPEIQSGNIGYKIAQRLGGFAAIGPFILGLNRPVNDLSRGATLEDILNTSIITAYQAVKEVQ